MEMALLLLLNLLLSLLPMFLMLLFEVDAALAGMVVVAVVVTVDSYGAAVV